jgi:hypothetical protein
MTCAGLCAGLPWRMMPKDLPLWVAVSQSTQRWLNATVFEAIVPGVRVVRQLVEGRQGRSSAAIFERHPRRSAPESGPRAGDDGAPRQRGSKVPMAVDPLGHLLALHVTTAREQELARVAQLAAPVQAVIGAGVDVTLVDQGGYGDRPAEAAAERGMSLEGVKLSKLTQKPVLPIREAER